MQRLLKQDRLSSNLGKSYENLTKISKNSPQNLGDILFLYNFLTHNEIPQIYAKYPTLNVALQKFAMDLTRLDLKFSRCKRICLYSSLIINSFKFNQFNAIKGKFGTPKLKAAKILLGLLCNDYEPDFMFRFFVYNRILKQNRDKNVYIKNDLIIIESYGLKFGVKTHFRAVNLADLSALKCNIFGALCLKNSEKLDKLYLVFPRNVNFKKHIEIKSQNNVNMGIKLVPYTLNNSLKGQKC